MHTPSFSNIKLSYQDQAVILKISVYSLQLQSSLYGKCIFADYNNVHKGQCATEFMKLKECYLVSYHTLGRHMIWLTRS
jgi:hypothetical protein